VSIKPGSFFQDAVMHNTDNGGIMADGRIGSDADLKLGVQSPKKFRVTPKYCVPTEAVKITRMSNNAIG